MAYSISPNFVDWPAAGDVTDAMPWASASAGIGAPSTACRVKVNLPVMSGAVSPSGLTRSLRTSICALVDDAA